MYKKLNSKKTAIPSLIALIFIFSALTGNAQKLNANEFRGKAQYLNRLVKYIPCIDSVGEKIVTGPVNYGQTISGLVAFTSTYKNHTGNLYFGPTKIRFNFFLENIFRHYSGDGFYGLVFHYGYYPQTKKIVYILSRGTLDTKGDTISSNDEIGYCPFPNGENGQNNEHFIVLANVSGNPYKIINRTIFDGLKQDYRDSVLVDTSSTDTAKFVPISDVPDHPEMVYHSPQELFSFFSEYESNPNLFLYLGHGSLLSEGLTKKRHTPILVFGDSVSFFPLDNIDYPSIGLNFPYRNKALDIGRQCPPNCPSSANPCLAEPSSN